MIRHDRSSVRGLSAHGSKRAVWALIIEPLEIRRLLSVSFTGPVNWAAGFGAAGVAARDFNGDNKLDLAVANFGADTVSLLLGNGSGGFSAPTNFTVGDAPARVIAADLNGDGQLDLVTGNQGSDDVSVLLGSGSGNFSVATPFAAGDGPDTVVAGDFNGDGKPDLATANFLSNNVSVLLGNGAGGFAAPTNFAAGTSSFSLTAADLNGDGSLDLATANQLSNNVSVLLGDGSGNFSAAANFAAGLHPTAVAAADFNGDGKLDLVTANENSNSASVLLGNGSGGFAAPTNFASGNSPFSLVIDEFDGDGKLDLAVASRNGDTVSVLLGNGAGGFGAPVSFAVGDFPQFVTAADLNGDGRKDLIAANTGTNNVSVLLNAVPPAPVAPGLSVSDATVTEGNSATTASFTVTRSGDTSGASDVFWSTADGTAASPDDYAAVPLTLLHFAAGETSKTISVAVNGDTSVEADEMFYVNLSSPSGATIADGQGAGTITNDDLGGTIQFSSAAYSANENGGSILITVTRSGGLSSGASVQYATSNGTAGGSDYTAAAGTLTFAAGETSKTFSIAINNDSLQESLHETVNLTLSNPAGGASLGSPFQSVLTITDNEPRIIATGLTNLTADKKRAFTGVVARFTDPDFTSVASLAATINWGDGSSTAGQIVWNSTAQRWDVIGAHTYAKKGSYSLLITISDANGATAAAVSKIKV